MKETQPIVHIVDDDQAVRTALEWILRTAGFRSRAYPSAEAFLRTYPREQVAGCILLDVRMPGMSGLELQDVLHDEQVNLPVVMITGHGDVATAVHALKHGAADFIQKPLDRKTVLDRIREALSRQAGAQARDSQTRESKARYETLTPREREVMRLIVAGNLNKQIAADLGLSTRTVEKHRAQAMAKMGAATAAELANMANLLPPADAAGR